MKEANSKRLKELNEYNEDSIYPPTLKQVHDAGIFLANAKAAACALQPPDPSRTMAFMNELIQEVRAKPILTFASERFWNSASSVDDESYLELERQTIEMLQSLKLFLTFVYRFNIFFINLCRFFYYCISYCFNLSLFKSIYFLFN